MYSIPQKVYDLEERSNILSYRYDRKNLSTNSESALKTAFKILSNMYLYDGREKVPNYGKIPNGA